MCFIVSTGTRFRPSPSHVRKPEGAAERVTRSRIARCVELSRARLPLLCWMRRSRAWPLRRISKDTMTTGADCMPRIDFVGAPGARDVVADQLRISAEALPEGRARADSDAAGAGSLREDRRAGRRAAGAGDLVGSKIRAPYSGHRRWAAAASSGVRLRRQRNGVGLDGLRLLARLGFRPRRAPGSRYRWPPTASGRSARGMGICDTGVTA